MNIHGYIKSLRIILYIQFIGNFVIALMFWLVIQANSMNLFFDSKQKNILNLILIIVLIMSYYGGNYLFENQIKKINTYPEPEKSLKEYRNAFIIRSIIFSIVPFFIFFIYMLTGTFQLLVLGIVVNIVYLKILYPVKDKIFRAVGINEKDLK